MQREGPVVGKQESLATGSLRREASEETLPVVTQILDLEAPEMRENKFLPFKVPSLWCFVTVTLANRYNHESSKLSVFSLHT